MQADRVTGAEPAGAKAGAGSVTGARCAPNVEAMSRIVRLRSIGSRVSYAVVRMRDAVENNAQTERKKDSDDTECQ